MTININQAKKIFEAFFKAEADYYTKDAIPNLEDHQKSAKYLKSFTSDVFSASITWPEKLHADEYYQKRINKPPFHPRVIFKISLYKHEDYGDVWLAYVTGENPQGEKMEDYYLSYIYMLAKIDENWKIVRSYLYSSEDFEWYPIDGTSKLKLEALEGNGPYELERYGEPSDSFHGLENYLTEI